MRLYLAPMEAITGYIFRNAYDKCFGDCDRFYTPFVASKKLSSREKNDCMPEHNVGMDVVPQILTNKAEDFIAIARKLQFAYGYNEVNLNLGCPSGTVVSKNRGAGFLRVPEELDRFLEEVCYNFSQEGTDAYNVVLDDWDYTAQPMKLSIKTRIGVEDTKDWEQILEIYNKYPLTELVVHPRRQIDFYKGTVDLEAFRKACEISRLQPIYNGDIRSKEDYDRLMEVSPVESVMIGRGILVNPGLFGEIKGKPPITSEELMRFVDEIYRGYLEIMSGDANTLFKMKELWSYLSLNYEEPEKVLKKIKKANSHTDYEIAVREIGKMPLVRGNMFIFRG